MADTQDTIAALATPVGTSAIALLRVSGPRCVEIAAALAPPCPPARVATRANFHAVDGTLLDDVLLTFYKAPGSYTGEDGLEISCHGNPYIAQRILEDLLARGCRLAEPGEFTRRAFLGGRLDLSQAEAVADLICARSARALQAANQQLRGALGRRAKALIDGLIVTLAQIEAYIDFPDEDLPEEDRQSVQKRVANLKSETDKLLSTNHYGNILRDGLRTVILGLPNVGKSSLLNALVGRERALVSDQPGTTRDYLEESILLGQHSLRLIDTAGINASPSALERLGMEKTVEQMAEADLKILVVDGTLPPPDLPAEIRQQLVPENTLVIANKSDLPEAPGLVSAWEGFERISTSAHTGAGLDALIQALQRRAEAFHVELGDEIIAINARHAEALEGAKRALVSASDLLKNAAPSELVASELRMVLAAYGQISGVVDNERVLDQLFGTFCIGK